MYLDVYSFLHSYTLAHKVLVNSHNNYYNYYHTTAVNLHSLQVVPFHPSEQTHKLGSTHLPPFSHRGLQMAMKVTTP